MTSIDTDRGLAAFLAGFFARLDAKVRADVHPDDPDPDDIADAEPADDADLGDALPGDDVAPAPRRPSPRADPQQRELYRPGDLDPEANLREDVAALRTAVRFFAGLLSAVASEPTDAVLVGQLRERSPCRLPPEDSTHPIDTW